MAPLPQKRTHDGATSEVEATARLDAIYRASAEYGDYWVARFGARLVRIMQAARRGEAAADAALTVRVWNVKEHGFRNACVAELAATFAAHPPVASVPSKFYQARVGAAEYLAWPVYQVMRAVWHGTDASGAEEAAGELE